MSKKGKYKIPFDHSGNLLDWVANDGSYWDGKGNRVQACWEDNYQFHDTLKYVSYSQGRSSAHIYWLSTSSNRKFHMTLKDFDQIMQKSMMIDNKISGDFTFAKRGSNFMLIPVFPANQSSP